MSDIEEKPATITIDDLAKIDLRIVKILDATAIPEAKKLIKLTVDAGENKPRTVFAGIKASYEPQDLIGKQTLMVANLAPREMSFGTSEGMLLVAVASDRSGLWLLEPHAGATPGTKVQ